MSQRSWQTVVVGHYDKRLKMFTVRKWNIGSTTADCGWWGWRTRSIDGENVAAGRSKEEFVLWNLRDSLWQLTLLNSPRPDLLLEGEAATGLPEIHICDGGNRWENVWLWLLQALSWQRSERIWCSGKCLKGVHMLCKISNLMASLSALCRSTASAAG